MLPGLLVGQLAEVGVSVGVVRPPPQLTRSATILIAVHLVLGGGVLRQQVADHVLQPRNLEGKRALAGLSGPGGGELVHEVVAAGEVQVSSLAVVIVVISARE